jgi:phosphoglycerate dehydrogenase-like enzyme
MAEYTLGWALWTTQNMERLRTQQRAREWREVNPTRLRGATLCVVGLGDIGRTIARSAHALGMVVVGESRSGRKAREVDRVLRTAALPRALAAADFVVLTVPLTEATRGLIDAAALAAMRSGAWLINVARGAVLDVFAEEPLPSAHPLWALDNAVITPHISGPSTPDEINPIFADNLQRYLTNRPLRHVADRRRGY